MGASSPLKRAYCASALLGIAVFNNDAAGSPHKCSRPPFGDTEEHYQEIRSSFAQAVAATPNLPPQFLMSALQAALIEACEAKFSHGSRKSYYANGITDETIDSSSTAELANRWFQARNTALAAQNSESDNQEDDSRIYALFECLKSLGTCDRAVSYSFNTLKECRSYARDVTHTEGQPDGRFPLNTDQWFECRSKRIETWQSTGTQ